MTDNPKKAAQQALYEFRKEHGESDIALVRNRLKAILDAPPGQYTVKEIIEAGKALSKLHGAYGQEKPLARGDAEPPKEATNIPMTPEQEARLKSILGQNAVR